MENSKLKNSRKNSKLKNSAFFRPLHAEKMAKKPACSTCHFCRGLFAWMKICTYCIIFISLTMGLFLSRRASFSTIDELNVSNPVRTPMHKSAEVARTRSFAMRISKLVVIIVSNPLYTTCGSVKVLSRVKKKIFRRQTQELKKKILPPGSTQPTFETRPQGQTLPTSDWFTTISRSLTYTDEALWIKLLRVLWIQIIFFSIDLGHKFHASERRLITAWLWFLA